MRKVLAYIRDFAGLREDEIPSVSSKRDRDDDDPPAMKKYKTVRSHFPKIMPSDGDEEWTSPKTVPEAHRVRYIPIVQEISTSTPSAQSSFNMDKIFKKPLDSMEFSRLTIKPSTSSEPLMIKRPSILAERQKSLREFIGKSDVAPLTKKPSLFKQSSSVPDLDFNSIMNKLNQRSLSKKPDICGIPHFNKDSDPYEFEGTSSKYKYFKTSNKSPMKTKENVEIVEISDSEDYNYYIVKEPKDNSGDCERRQPVVDLDDQSDDEKDEGPCNRCKPRQYESIKSRYRTSMSPKISRDKLAFFKTPLSSSKAKLNSHTPFWKSQKNIGTSQIRGGRLPSRTIIEKCVRLDEKKKYEELLRLTASSYFRKGSNKPSLLDFSDTHKRIKDLTLSINSSQEYLDGNYGGKSKRNIPDTGSPEEGTIVLSDSDQEQALSVDESSTSSVRIVPVNTLKMSLKEKPVANVNWMEDLNRKYKNINLDKKKEEGDFLFISSERSKLNHEFYLKKKARDIKLKIDLTVEAEEIEETPLPELTDEQQAIINNALRPHPPNQVLVEKFNLAVRRMDIHTLSGLNWLNDEVINFYMNLIMERSKEKKDLPKVYGMNTFFYPKLMQSGHAGLKRWTKKVDIFAHDIIIAPVHLGVHWCVSLIDFRKKTVNYYDSMGGNNMPCCDALLKYLEDESMDKKKTKFDTTGWKKECVKNIPQQMNGSDCGMFSCTFAEFLSRDASITFSQSDMPYLRRKMILEIVQGALLL